MKKNLLGGGRDYSSPQTEILGILSETVLCQSGTNELTLGTGVTWSEGPDAEW